MIMVVEGSKELTMLEKAKDILVAVEFSLCKCAAYLEVMDYHCQEVNNIVLKAYMRVIAECVQICLAEIAKVCGNNANIEAVVARSYQDNCNKKQGYKLCKEICSNVLVCGEWLKIAEIMICAYIDIMDVLKNKHIYGLSDVIASVYGNGNNIPNKTDIIVDRMLEEYWNLHTYNLKEIILPIAISEYMIAKKEMV